MGGNIFRITKILITLTCFFASAFFGAALVLFTGWPVALLTGAVCFMATQQVSGAMARRRDKRAVQRELAQVRAMGIDFEEGLRAAGLRIDALDQVIDQRTDAQGRKIVSELKVL